MQAVRLRVTFSFVLLSSVCVLLTWPSSVSAQPLYTPYWGIDGAYTYTSSGEVTIPTGYWWDNYYWNGYGGYNGWVYTSPHNYSWLNGWGAPTWYPGFADLDYYDWSYSQTVYKYSYYWNPQPYYAQQNILDITAFAGPNGLSPLTSAQTSYWSFGRAYPYHIWSAYLDGYGLLNGSFTPLVWVQDDSISITNYMLGQGDDLTDINPFLASPAMQYLLSQGGSGMYIGLEQAVVPEPTSLALAAAGALGLMMRVRRSGR